MTFDAFWRKQGSKRRTYWKQEWEKHKLEQSGYGLTFIRRVLEHIGVGFLDHSDQIVKDSTRLDSFYGREPLTVTYDNGMSIPHRPNSCMDLTQFKES